MADDSCPSRPLRIEPIPPAERVGAVRDLLDQASAGTGSDANIFATFARAPGLFRKWLPFGGKLLNGKIPGRERELLILRTAWNCAAEYEWGQHALIGAACGLSAQEIDRVCAGPDAPGWEPFDALLLRAADELHTLYSITDGTWDRLMEHYDTAQLIELAMLVGHYHLVAMTLNTLGVQLDEELTGFPHRPGS
jgi:alkylhydroperoxidase family enzyme